MSFNVYSLREVQQGGFIAQDASGNEFEVDDGQAVQVIIPAADVAELLSNYDPTSGTSPLVAYARPLARAILDALRLHAQGGE